jgi:hypothetical protein
MAVAGQTVPFKPNPRIGFNRIGDPICLRRCGTGSHGGFAVHGIDVLVDEVLAELTAMATDGHRDQGGSQETATGVVHSVRAR